MKFDYEKLNRGAKRTVGKITDTFSTLLSQKQFSDITMNEISIESGYPRATLYNYFDDKYDLLDYLWESSFEQIQKPDGTINTHEHAHQFLSFFFDFFEEKSDKFGKMLKNNASDDFFVSSIKYFSTRKLKKVIPESEYKKIDTVIPYELGIEYLASIFFLIIDWIFIKGHKVSRQEAFLYVDKLIVQKVGK